MSTYQSVTIIGNVGDDPEVRYMPNNDAVANISVATSENWKDKQGNKQTHTEWHRCVLFRRQAEVCGEYVRKGDKLHIEGRLRTRKWQDKDGQDRYSTEIIVSHMTMLGSRDKAAAPTTRKQEASAHGSDPAQLPADFEDDIPFNYVPF